MNKMKILHIDRMIGGLDIYIRNTNLTQTECYRLSLMAPKLLTYDIIQNSIPIEGTYKDATHRKMSVLEVDFEANKKFLQENLYGTGDSTATAASEN